MATAAASNDTEKVGARWVYERSSPMGGAAGEAFTNTLASSGMPPAAVLAREAIQNSVDAKASADAKVEVRFTTKLLAGADKASFIAASGLQTISERTDKLGIPEPNCLSSLESNASPLRLLYVDDWNTTGLEGNPKDPDSKFYRFLLSLGDAGKEHEEHSTGGSYGYGKSVYSSNSGILTIFAYSRTKDETGKLQSLLFGCGYFRKHKLKGEHLTGRAWFGSDLTPAPHAQQLVVPLHGAAADEAAAALGFIARKPTELGTGVLIVDSTVDSAGILRGVEDWWWPRLYAHLLDVEVVNEDGSTEVPRPRKRDDLKPFIDAYDIATGKTPDQAKVSYRKELNRFEKTIRIGTIGLKVIERQDDNQYVVPEERLDTVALIRSPLMVVAYHRHWQVGSPVVAGAFIAHDDIDDILRASEPPAHDRWDPETRRLKDATGNKRQIVERVLASVRRHLKLFQDSAAPPPSPRPKRLSFLERTLASFLAPGKRGPQTQPNPSSAPISLTYDKEPRPAALEDGKLELTAVFSVRLKPDEDIAELPVRVRVKCPLLEDGREGDALPMVVQSSSPTTPDPEKPDWLRLVLKHGETTKFECISDPYDADWTVKFVPEIEPVGAAA